MSSAETVAHLHAAMLWDFRLLIVSNVILFLALLFVILSRD